MVSVNFLRQVALSLSEWVDDHKVLWFLELDCRVPCLACRDLLGSLFDEPSIKPEVECKLIKIEFNANYSWSGGSKLLDDFLLLILIRYSDFYNVINETFENTTSEKDSAESPMNGGYLRRA